MGTSSCPRPGSCSILTEEFPGDRQLPVGRSCGKQLGVALTISLAVIHPGLTWLSGTCPTARRNQLGWHPWRGRDPVPPAFQLPWHPGQSLRGTQSELRIHSFNQQIFIAHLLYARQCG